MVTRVGISLTLKNNEECELDTLSLKKVLFGTFKFHPVVTKAIKNAEEIESILNLF